MEQKVYDNPWHSIDYSATSSLSPYNNKTYWTVEWINKFNIPVQMKYQIKNTENNRMCLVNSPWLQYIEGEIFVHWNKRKWSDPDILIPVKDILIRIDDKKYQRYKTVQNILRIGDFVKCEGTRKGDWNKVESISKSERIFGQKYLKPEEGASRIAGSDNHISKIVSTGS